MPGENEPRTNQEVTDFKQGSPSRRTMVWGWGAEQKIKKKKIYPFRNLTTRKAVKGHVGKGVSLEPGVDQKAPHPHTVTTNNSEGRMDKQMDVFLGSG